ncbi:MAG: tetratricopeptide repeat protein [bacterium]
MVLDFVLIFIAIIGLGIIAAILIRKMPKLKAINTQSITSERNARTRNVIIEQRLQRKFSDFQSQTLGRIGKQIQKGRQSARQIYAKLRSIEREYRKKSQELNSPTQRAESQKKVVLLLEEARGLEKEEKYTEAEQRCIEVIAIEPKSLDAYELLGDIYLKMKDYDHAREVFTHAIDLGTRKYRVKGPRLFRSGQAETYGGYNNQVACLRYDLCMAFKGLARYDEAVESCQSALKLMPNNPKFLSGTLELAIEAKKKLLALRTFNKLKEVNPENNRLPEYEAQVKAL